MSYDGGCGDSSCVLCQKDARIAVLERDIKRLKSAVDTIPAAIMLGGGPPYKLTFTKACLREIMESQIEHTGPAPETAPVTEAPDSAGGNGK